MDETVVPFPMPEMTPPETKIYFVLSLLDVIFFDRGTIYIVKSQTTRQWGNQFLSVRPHIMYSQIRNSCSGMVYISSMQFFINSVHVCINCMSRNFKLL